MLGVSNTWEVENDAQARFQEVRSVMRAAIKHGAKITGHVPYILGQESLFTSFSSCSVKNLDENCIFL